MANFPGMASVPLPAVQSRIPSDDWEAFLDAWITLLGIRLNVSDKEFQETAEDDPSGVAFLNSFYEQAASGTPCLQHGPKGLTLRKLSFLATRRYILDLRKPPESLLHWKFLGNLSCCYPSSTALKTLLSSAWDRHSDRILSSMEEAKAMVIEKVSTGMPSHGSKTFVELRWLTILASVLPQCGQILMAGTDYLDTMTETYQKQSSREDIHKAFTANVYVGLVSLLKAPPNLSLLLDQLFSLKASAGVGTPQMIKEKTLLSDLVCSSDLLLRLEKYLAAHPQKRGQDLLTSLRAYQMETKFLHSRYQRRRKVDKGKGPSSDLQIPDVHHAHKMSLVSQVQDLFPDLGSAFVVRLLDVYGDNPETVVAHLLDDSLPPEIQALDRTEQLPETAEPQHDHLAPKPTPPRQPSPPPARKNVFDTDVDIAELSLSDNAKGKLRFGRADPDLTADEVLADRSQHAVNKAAILSALANFDSDDDERDDTYDVADVGGTVDAATAGTDADADAEAKNKRMAADQLDMTLFRAYKSNAALFNRDSATRRSQPRASLKRETNMTDEAIEGWAVMLSRDSRRLARLEDRLAVDADGVGSGALNQPELASTSYRRPQAAGSDEESADESSGARGGRGRGRGGHGRGRGRGGRGGRPPQDPNTPQAHQKKEQNKASRANHNRRQQRAKRLRVGVVCLAEILC